MSLSLYEEALLEAIKIKELAEENAKKAVLEYLNPKIKKMVEEKLYSQSNMLIQEKKEEGDDDDKKKLLFSSDEDISTSKEKPQEEATTVANIAGAMSVSEPEVDEEFEKDIKKLEEKILACEGVSDFIRNNEEFIHILENLLVVLEDKFQNIEKKINNKNLIDNYQMRLESMYEKMHALKENCNMKQKKEEMVEDLDIDIVLDDEDEEVQQEAKSSDDSEKEMEECISEEEQLDDEDEIEIDDEDLKKEIAELKSELSSKESSDEEDSDEEKSEESEECDSDEESKLEEGSEEESEEESDECEHCQLKKEMKVQQSCLESKTMWLAEAKKRAGKPSAVHCKKQATEASKKLKESQEKLSSLKKKIDSKSSQSDVKKEKAISEKFSLEVSSLKKQLEETKLLNQKLIVTNKLLQLESLTQKQKRVAIEQLDEASSTKEIKMVYESFTKALTSKKPLSESTVIGSSSRSVRSSTITESVDDELYGRWEVLAGIK